jgi:hypothetical protein
LFFHNHRLNYFFYTVQTFFGVKGRAPAWEPTSNKNNDYKSSQAGDWEPDKIAVKKNS